MKIVNTVGVNHAKALIRAGKVDLDSDWSFTADDGNAILGDNNWAEYEKWFLCIDTDENEETKARYKYPYGKNGKVYRSGVIAAKQRSAQQGDDNIFKVADELLRMIDEKYSEEESAKSLNAIVKKVYKGDIKSVNNTEFTIESVVSDETIDRYGEVILASAWKRGLENYKKHPILLSSHNYDDLTSQIGEVVDIKIKDKQLIAKMKYYVGEGNEQADWGYKLAKKGLAAFSVGFIPKSYTYDPEEIKSLLNIEDKNARMPKLVYKEVELLEISQVLIPANPSALAKDLANISDPVIKSIYELGKNMFESEVTKKQVETPVEEPEEEASEITPGQQTTIDLSFIQERLAKIEHLISDLVEVVYEVNKKIDTMVDKQTVSSDKVDIKDEKTKLAELLNELRNFTNLLK